MTQPLSQQAVFLVKSQSFQRYVERKRDLFPGCIGAREATEWLKSECNITSRTQLDTQPECAVAFDRVLSEYRRSLNVESAPLKNNRESAS